MMVPRTSLAPRQPLQNATEYQYSWTLNKTGISVKLWVLNVPVKLRLHWSDNHSILWRSWVNRVYCTFWLWTWLLWLSGMMHKVQRQDAQVINTRTRSKYTIHTCSPDCFGFMTGISNHSSHTEKIAEAVLPYVFTNVPPTTFSHILMKLEDLSATPTVTATNLPPAKRDAGNAILNR